MEPLGLLLAASAVRAARGVGVWTGVRAGEGAAEGGVEPMGGVAVASRSTRWTSGGVALGAAAGVGPAAGVDPLPCFRRPGLETSRTGLRPISTLPAPLNFGIGVTFKTVECF